MRIKQTHTVSPRELTTRPYRYTYHTAIYLPHCHILTTNGHIPHSQIHTTWPYTYQHGHILSTLPDTYHTAIYLATRPYTYHTAIYLPHGNILTTRPYTYHAAIYLSHGHILTTRPYTYQTKTWSWSGWEPLWLVAPCTVLECIDRLS